MGDETPVNLWLTNDDEYTLPFKGRERVGMGFFRENDSLMDNHHA